MAKRLSNIEFLKRHSYRVDGMTEESAKEFIIEQSKIRMPYKYMVNRARQISK